jgi:hypothetical protein
LGENWEEYMGSRTIIALAAVLAGVCAPAFAASEGPALLKAMQGTFRNVAGGTCEQPFYKSGEVNKTVRGEEGMAATVINAGVTINGELVMRGARIGQLVNTTDDKVIFLFEDRPDGKLHFSALGPPATGWGEITLERCP